MTRLRLAFLPARRYANAGILAVTLCPCLSVCLSVTRRRCSVETDGRNNLVFGMGASFNQSYTVF